MTVAYQPRHYIGISSTTPELVLGERALMPDR